MDVHCSIGICTPVPMEPSTVSGVMRLSRITPEWHRARGALLSPLGHNIAEIYVDGMEVGVARNMAARRALDDRMKYLFFLDYDTIPSRDALCRLVYHLDNHPEYDVAAGLYCSKSQPPWPLLWREWGNGVSWDFAVGDVLMDRVVGVPMGCTLIRTSVFERLPTSQDNPWFKTIHEPAHTKDGDVPQFATEDLFFCQRLEKELGGKILMDTGILCEHIDHASGIRFTLPSDSLPRKRAAERTSKKTVLHLGCGPVTAGILPDVFGKDEWKEIRVDLDAAAKPDVVASITDLRAFADKSADCVYSSHTIEHLSAHEVPVAFAEFFRVLRPGGFVLLMCPDLATVAKAILDGKVEETAYESPAGPIRPLDILYGYSEFIRHGNVFQQHKTGFTADSLQAKLEAAGFVRVEAIRDEAAWGLCAKAFVPVGPR